MNVSRGEGMTIDNRVELLSIVLFSDGQQSRRTAEEILLLAGSKMSPESAERMERQITTTKDGLAQRIALLAFYASDRSLPISKKRRLGIVLWLIENQPDSFASGSPFARISPRIDPVGYEQVKSAWLRQTAATNPTIASLLNAAAFFAPNDSEESERLRMRPGYSLDYEDGSTSATRSGIRRCQAARKPGVFGFKSYLRLDKDFEWLVD